MIYSPQSGCRSIAMLTEVDPPKESIMQRKISVQVDMDMFENDDWEQETELSLIQILKNKVNELETIIDKLKTANSFEEFKTLL